MPSSIKHLAVFSYKHLLQATTVYNCRYNWGRIAPAIANFIEDIMLHKKYSIIHNTKTGSTRYSLSLAELNVQNVWEFLLRSLSLYNKINETPLTKSISMEIKYFLSIALTENYETCQRIVYQINGSIHKSSKNVKLPKIINSNSNIHFDTNSDIILNDKYQVVCKFIITHFPKCAYVFNKTLEPGYIVSPSTLPASLSDIKLLTKEVHPDKLNKELPEKVRKVAEYGIIILNQLKENGTFKLQITYEDVYKIIMT